MVKNIQIRLSTYLTNVFQFVVMSHRRLTTFQSPFLNLHSMKFHFHFKLSDYLEISNFCLKVIKKLSLKLSLSFLLDAEVNFYLNTTATETIRNVRYPMRIIWNFLINVSSSFHDASPSGKLKLADYIIHEVEPG